MITNVFNLTQKVSKIPNALNGPKWPKRASQPSSASLLDIDIQTEKFRLKKLLEIYSSKPKWRLSTGLRF